MTFHISFRRNISSYPFSSSHWSIAFTDRLGKREYCCFIIYLSLKALVTFVIHLVAALFFLKPLPQKAVSLNQTVSLWDKTAPHSQPPGSPLLFWSPKPWPNTYLFLFLSICWHREWLKLISSTLGKTTESTSSCFWFTSAAQFLYLYCVIFLQDPTNIF